jgi:lipoprotein NlpD
MRLTTAAGIGVLAAALAGCAAQRSAPVVDRSARPGGVELRPAMKPAPKPAAVAAPSAPAAPEGYYLVKRGDTLYSIALEHGVDYRELAQWNQLDDPARIQAGQPLRVKPDESHAVTVGRPAGAAPIEARPLELPAAKEIAKEAPAPAPAVVSAPAATDFVWPARGKILAGFAEPRSKGIDIDGKLGDPIVAAAAGRVTYIGSGIPGLGKLVVIKHDNGFITVYAHNRSIVVKEQQSVARGQKIAELGSSDADRPKLHFQIRKGSAAVDPLRYLPAL